MPRLGPVDAPVSRADILRKARPKRPTRSVKDTAALLKAIADPTRLAMAALLERQTEPLCVCHIEARFQLSQPTISHHLKVLRDAELVTSEKRGAWVYYELVRERLGDAPGLSELLRSIELAAGERSCCG